MEALQDYSSPIANRQQPIAHSFFSRSARIRTQWTRFGAALLSQEHRPELLDDTCTAIEVRGVCLTNRRVRCSASGIAPSRGPLHFVVQRHGERRCDSIAPYVQAEGRRFELPGPRAKPSGLANRPGEPYTATFRFCQSGAPRNRSSSSSHANQASSPWTSVPLMITLIE